MELGYRKINQNQEKWQNVSQKIEINHGYVSANYKLKQEVNKTYVFSLKLKTVRLLSKQAYFKHL